MAGLRIDPQFVVRCTVKNGTTVGYGSFVVFTGTDDEIDLPGGTGSLLTGGFALEAGTGDAAGSVKVDVALGGPSLPGIASGAIAAGNTVVTNSTTGKLSAGTTAGAIVGYALNNTSSDGDRVWVRR